MGLEVIVAGGGIGGLAVAVGLRRIGARVTVLERVPDLRPVGAGITLHANAMEALDRLDLAERIAAVGCPLLRGEIRRHDGSLLQAQELGPIVRALGEPDGVALHRGRLQEVLLEAVGEERVRTGAEVVGFEERGERVVVALADGQRLEADVLVGADGIHSKIADAVRGERPLRYAGYTAWRGLADASGLDVVPGTGIELAGPGARLGVIPIGDGLVYWFCTANAPPGSGEGSEEAEHARVAEHFGGWAEPAPALIAATPPDRLLRNDIVDRPPDRRWGTGRVTLLGDAAHAMTPNMGQGAGQAIEDAVVLAAALGRGEPVAALRRYEELRRPRAHWFLRTSWRIGRLGQIENPVAVGVRDLAARMPFAPAIAAPGLRRMLRFPYDDARP